jgi:hypothetical protein
VVISAELPEKSEIMNILHGRFYASGQEGKNTCFRKLICFMNVNAGFCFVE